MAVYLALGELKATLADEIDETSREWDDQLQVAIAAASRHIERACNDVFAPDESPSARTFEPRDGQHLTVGSLATTTGLTVEIDETDSGTYGAALPAGTWRAERVFHRNIAAAPLDTLVAIAPTRWPDGRTAGGRVIPGWRHRGRVRVTARWGWPETPEDVIEACQILAAGLFRAKNTGGGVAAAARGLTTRGGATPEYVLQAATLLDPLLRPDM